MSKKGCNYCVCENILLILWVNRCVICTLKYNIKLIAMQKNHKNMVYKLCISLILIMSTQTVNAQVVINSRFKPMSYEEMMKPYQDMINANLRAEEKFEENYISAMKEIKKTDPNYQLAAFYLNQCIDLNQRFNHNLFDNHGSLLYNYGTCNLNIQQQEIAIESFYSAGYWYGNNENYIKAIECYDITLQYGYNDKVTYARAWCYSNTNNEEKSSTDYETIITNGSSNKTILAMSYNNLAYKALNNKEYDKSLKLINKAIEVSNAISTIWDTRGELYYHLQKYEECILDMNIAISIEEGESAYANSYYYRGLAKLKLSKKSSAKRDLKKAAKYGNVHAQRVLSGL